VATDGALLVADLDDRGVRVLLHPLIGRVVNLDLIVFRLHFIFFLNDQVAGGGIVVVSFLLFFILSQELVDVEGLAKACSHVRESPACHRVFFIGLSGYVLRGRVQAQSEIAYRSSNVLGRW